MANLKRILTGAIDSTTKGIKTVYQTLAETGDGTYAPVVAATLTGSKVCLSTETKPAGVQGDTLLEYNATTKETKVYKYITGQWREI